MSYMETAKKCPKCHKMTLFLKSRVKKIDFDIYESVLGVRCTSCNYEADLERVLKDE